MENENEQIQDTELQEQENQEEVDWKARAEELEQKAIKQREKTKELKSKLSEYEVQQKVSNEPDYAKLAFLETKGITHPDDQKVVQDEANRLKLPLTDVMAMKHIKAKLEENKDQRDASAGMPKGRGKGGGSTQHDIDYWIDRQKPDGTYETPEDNELAVKVINARIKKETNANKFSDVMFTG